MTKGDYGHYVSHHSPRHVQGGKKITSWFLKPASTVFQTVYWNSTKHFHSHPQPHTLHLHRSLCCRYLRWTFTYLGKGPQAQKGSLFIEEKIGNNLRSFLKAVVTVPFYCYLYPCLLQPQQQMTYNNSRWKAFWCEESSLYVWFCLIYLTLTSCIIIIQGKKKSENATATQSG